MEGAVAAACLPLVPAPCWHCTALHCTRCTWPPVSGASADRVSLALSLSLSLAMYEWSATCSVYSVYCGLIHGGQVLHKSLLILYFQK